MRRARGCSRLGGMFEAVSPGTPMGSRAPATISAARRSPRLISSATCSELRKGSVAIPISGPRSSISRPFAPVARCRWIAATTADITAVATIGCEPRARARPSRQCPTIPVGQLVNTTFPVFQSPRTGGDGFDHPDPGKPWPGFEQDQQAGKSLPHGVRPARCRVKGPDDHGPGLTISHVEHSKKAALATVETPVEGLAGQLGASADSSYGRRSVALLSDDFGHGVE